MEKLYIREKSGRKRLATELICDSCKKPFLKSNTNIRRSEKVGRKGHFCTPKCATDHQRSRVVVKCCQCEKEFDVKPARIKKSKSGLLFCSVECKNLGQRVENCHPDMMPDHYSESKATYRSKALRNLPNVCACKDCGFDIVNVLDVHHIDCNKQNCDLTNLIILCPTHHKMTHLGYSIIESGECIVVNKDG